jgi:TonB-dependent SusC/RagA subfamily outer membrane receptor
MMEYYKTKTLELQSEISQFKEKEKKIFESIGRLHAQVAEEEQKNNKSAGKLLLQLLNPTAGTYNFTVSYITQKAFWNPYYDMRIESINKPIALSYKAKLVQTTGIDWKNVKLTLATSTPNQNGNAPVFRSWFLSYIDPVQRMQDQLASNSIQSMLQGRAAGVEVNNLQEVVVVGYGSVKTRRNNSFKEAVPLYIVDGNPSTAEEVNRIDKKSIKTMEVLKDAQATAIYGSKGSHGAIVITLKQDLGDYVTVNENQLNVTFDIDIPYDVPGNGKEQSVSLKELSMPAFYKYYSAPRLDKESYLLGEIADWEKLNLLPGEANIIFEGTFIGKSVIDPLSTMDTLNLTLGKDKRVVVKREKLVDFSTVKFLGSNKKQIFTYEITVKNNKKEKITMLLKDQYPISTNKDIEVELLESNGAANNTEIGVLTWTVNLEAGETKKYRVSYSAKYPKDKVVNIN